MRVWIVNNGEKSLFYEGVVDKRIARQIRLWLRAYFGWKRLAAMREGSEIYVFNADVIEARRRTWFKGAGA